MDFSRAKGVLMVILAASFWGLSGTVAQRMFQQMDISPAWLVTIRLLTSGFLLIFVGAVRKKRVWDIWKDWREAFRFLLFGFFGMLAVQYTYFLSIARGNAAVATLLQYVAPVFVILYSLLKERIKPRGVEGMAAFLALTGMFLLLTDGSFGELTVPFLSVIWGLLSAVSLAFYTLFGAYLLKSRESTVVTGWGMAIGGLFMSILHPPLRLPRIDWNGEMWLSLLFVVVFGTLVAFYLYLESLKYISAKESSLLGCAEPLVSVLASVLWLRVSFGFWQGIGTVLILGMIVLLSYADGSAKVKHSEEETIQL